MFAATKSGGNPPSSPVDTAYVGAATGTTSVSLSGLGLQQNDLVVLITGWEDDAGTPGPVTSGYTQAAAVTNVVGGADDVKLYVGYKLMGATPDTVVDVTPCAISLGTNTIAYVWRGINTSTPLAGTATTATGTGITVNPPAVSFSGTGIVVAVGIINIGTRQITSAPNGMLKFVQQLVTPVGSRTSVAAAAVYDNAYYDPDTFSTSADTSGPWAAATIALTYP